MRYDHTDMRRWWRKRNGFQMSDNRDDVWDDDGVSETSQSVCNNSEASTTATGPDSNGYMVIGGVAYCGETADVLEARKIAEEANRLVFIAQMRARFELDQEQAELENRQKNG